MKVGLDMLISVYINITNKSNSIHKEGAQNIQTQQTNPYSAGNDFIYLLQTV